MLGGIFATIGAGAHAAGPAVILAYVLSGLVSVCVALCYAEFASMVPVAGSAYTYAYATLGEIVAWVIGWDLILEYGLSLAPSASSFSDYVQHMLSSVGITLPAWAQTAHLARREHADRRFGGARRAGHHGDRGDRHSRIDQRQFRSSAGADRLDGRLHRRRRGRDSSVQPEAVRAVRLERHLRKYGTRVLRLHRIRYGNGCVRGSEETRTRRSDRHHRRAHYRRPALRRADALHGWRRSLQSALGRRGDARCGFGSYQKPNDLSHRRARRTCRKLHGDADVAARPDPDLLRDGARPNASARRREGRSAFPYAAAHHAGYRRYRNRLRGHLSVDGSAAAREHRHAGRLRDRLHRRARLTVYASRGDTAVSCAAAADFRRCGCRDVPLPRDAARSAHVDPIWRVVPDRRRSSMGCTASGIRALRTGIAPPPA